MRMVCTAVKASWMTSPKQRFFRMPKLEWPEFNGPDLTWPTYWEIISGPNLQAQHLKGPRFWDPNFAEPKFIGPHFLGSKAAGSDKSSPYSQDPILLEAAETGFGNKMKLFPHWINPEVKGQGHKESILSKDEIVAKTMTKKVEKSPPSMKHPMRGAKLEKKTEEEGITFFDAPQSLDNELKQQSLQSRGSWVLGLPHNNSKHCPQVTGITQPEHPCQISALTSAEGTGLYKENTQSRKKEFIGS